MRRTSEQRTPLSTGQKVAFSAFVAELVIAPTIAINMDNVRDVEVSDTSHHKRSVLVNNCNAPVGHDEFRTPNSLWNLSSAAGKIVARCLERSPKP